MTLPDCDEQLPVFVRHVPDARRTQVTFRRSIDTLLFERTIVVT